MANEIKFWYNKDWWESAFKGRDSRIVFDRQGSVYRDSISFSNLVCSWNGIRGPASFPNQGQITVFSNAHNGTYTGLIHVILESGTDVYELSSGVDTIETNQYHHVIIKIDNALQIARLKIDNVEVDTVSLTTGVALFNKLQQAVMYRYLNTTVNDHRYKGKVDDFRIYDFVTTNQNDEDMYRWGNQWLQHEEVPYVPPQGACRGVSGAIRVETDDYVQVRSMGIEYTPTNRR